MVLVGGRATRKVRDSDNARQFIQCLGVRIGHAHVSRSWPQFQSRPLAVSAGGVVGVLLIHALLVLPFVLTLSLPSTRRPNTIGAGASTFVSAAEPEITVVFIDEPTRLENTAPKPPALASRGTAPPDLQLVVLSPDPSPPTANVKEADSSDAQEELAPAEAAEHARLHGLYLGQVQARIERAWTRPRSEIGAPRFSCRARIQQDRRGVVIEVTLDHCNGSERWQQSLLSAVRTASPLPAPPDASVYVDILWLSFFSQAFEESGSTQGFEPATRVADAADRGALESFRQFVNGAQAKLKSDDKEASKVIHLTIIGTPRELYVPNQLPTEPPTAPLLPEPPSIDQPQQ